MCKIWELETKLTVTAWEKQYMEKYEPVGLMKRVTRVRTYGRIKGNQKETFLPVAI